MCVCVCMNFKYYVQFIIKLLHSNACKSIRNHSLCNTQLYKMLLLKLNGFNGVSGERKNEVWSVISKRYN